MKLFRNAIFGLLFTLFLTGGIAVFVLSKEPADALQPEQLLQWAKEICRTTGGQDFFYDGFYKTVSGDTANVVEILRSANGVRYAYPIGLGDRREAIVFVTENYIGRTNGYLVCSGASIPVTNRSGPFASLRRVADRVYYFESP
jgi:hypothetical protein